MDLHKYGVETHVGRVRSHNEDAHRVSPHIGLFVVADGMGGHKGGAEAAALASDFIVDQVGKGEGLTQAISRAHHAVKQAAFEGEGPEGMGTTVVALRISDHMYEISWVGDCRAYLWDGTDLHQLTKDHSYVQHLVDTGVIAEDDSDKHPYQDILIQALGASDMDDVAVDEIVDDFFRGEQILLCSDGLTKELDEAAIAEIFSEETDEQSKAETLVRAALDQGGNDNITAVVVSAADNAPVRLSETDTIPFLTQNLIPPGFRDKIRAWFRRLFKGARSY
jgi:protein phosphatase